MPPIGKFWETVIAAMETQPHSQARVGTGRLATNEVPALAKRQQLTFAGLSLLLPKDAAGK